MSNYSILSNSGTSSIRAAGTSSGDDYASSQQHNKIYFVAILRNDETLVKFTEYSGNFDELLEQILPKIFKTNGIKMTFNYEDYCFHYIYDNTIIYFCVTKNVFDKFRAFQFLERIKYKFESQYQKRVHTALPFAFQTEFLPILANETVKYCESNPSSSGSQSGGGGGGSSVDRLREVESHVNETKQILSQNIDRLTDRGERLHLLVDKSENLCETSISFKNTSREIARKYWWKRVKFIIVLIILLLIGLYFGLWFLCDGPTLQKCF